MRVIRFAMGLIAFVACSSADQPPTTVVPGSDADQMLFGLSLVVTSDGLIRVVLEADTAYQYEARQVSELRGLTVHFYNNFGERTSTLTAREGTYDWRTEDMEARGDVVATTPDQRRLSTEILIFTMATNEISGSEPFVFTAPDQRLVGESFTSDPAFKNVVALRPSGTLGRLDLDR